VTTDTFIDGLGTIEDQPLPAGVTIRFVIDPRNRQRDITVRTTADGSLMIYGMYRPLVIEPGSVNHIFVSTATRFGGKA
jgi:hypothetical protein